MAAETGVAVQGGGQDGFADSVENMATSCIMTRAAFRPQGPTGGTNQQVGYGLCPRFRVNREALIGTNRSERASEAHLGRED